MKVSNSNGSQTDWSNTFINPLFSEKYNLRWIFTVGHNVGIKHVYYKIAVVKGFIT